MDDLGFSLSQNTRHGAFPGFLTYDLALNPGWTNPIPVINPRVIESPIGGRGRGFYQNGAGANAAFWSAGDTAARDDHEGNCTVGIWMKIDDLPAIPESWVYAYSGLDADGTGLQNFLMSLILNEDGNFRSFWEWGTGTNGSFIFDEYEIALGEWVYVALRKSNTTGPGPAGTMDLALFVNGKKIQETTGQTNCSNGASGNFRIGHIETAGNVADNFFVGEMAGVYVWADALTDQQIADDFRRSLLLPFFTRVDLKVEVENAGGDLVNLADFEGLDWVDSVELGDSADNAVMTATVNLLREQKNLSVSHLKTDAKPNLTDIENLASYDPLLRTGRRVKIQAARVPLGTSGRNDQFHNVFEGHINEIGWGGEQAKIVCRDFGGILVDTYIEEEFDYSDKPPPEGAGPYAVEGEMQQILFDNDNATNGIRLVTGRTGSFDPVTLYVQEAGGAIVAAGTVPSPVDWEVLLWRQRREPILTALRNLAGQIGWECRYKFDQTAGEWRLIFREPERQRSVPLAVLAPEDILTVSQLSIKANSVRNIMRVSYPSGETGSLPAPAPLADFGINPAAAIERQGWSDVSGRDERMMAYYELEMSDSVTKYGRRFMEVSEASSSQIDTVIEAQRMAAGMVLDLHEPDEDQAITIPAMPELELQDFVRFLENDFLYTAAQDLAVQSFSHNFGEVAETTVTTRGKPSVGFKRWLSVETRPGVAIPGVIYPPDALTSILPGPQLGTIVNLNTRTDFFNFGKFLNTRNSSFNFFSTGIGNFPDSWHPTSNGVWNTDFKPSSTSLSGSRSLELITTGLPESIESDLIPVQGGVNVPFSFEITWQRVTGGSDYGVLVRVQWIGADRVTPISTATVGSFQGELGTAGEWFTQREAGVLPPAGARFAKITLNQLTAAGVASNVLIDAVTIYKTGRGFRLYKSASELPLAPLPLSGNPWQNIQFDLPPLFDTYDHGNNKISPVSFPGSGDGLTVREAGSYRYTLQVCMGSTTAGAGQYGNIRLTRNAGYDANQKHNPIPAVGDIVAQGPQTELIDPLLIDMAGLKIGVTNVLFAGICTITGSILLEQGDTLNPEWWSNPTIPGGTAIVMGQVDTGKVATFFEVKLELND